MTKVILASVIALGLSACSLTPAENVQALRAVNTAELKLEAAKDLKIKADKRAECATIRVKNAEVQLEDAKQNFEAIYKN